MKFVERVIRLPKSKGKLSRLEKENDPEALASLFVDMHVKREYQKVGMPRASALYDDCMRKRVIGTLFQLMETQFIGVRQGLVYGIGNAIHYWMQNSNAVFGERRYGWWQCAACRTIRYFGAPPKKPCEKCKASAKASIYYEHRMKLLKPWRLVGHPDMFFMSEDRAVRIAEIKTMAGEEFDKLVAPLIHHVWQLQTYMLGCSKDKELPIVIDKNVGYLFYVTKKGSEKHFPLKCFPVLWDNALVKKIIAKLKAYTEGLEDYPKNLPALHDDCRDKGFFGYRAKQCVARDECRLQFEKKKK
jgi:hypothetical protein